MKGETAMGLPETVRRLLERRSDLAGWSLDGYRRRREELYLIGADVEARRDVEQHQYGVRVYVPVGDGIGESGRLFPADLPAADAARQLEETVYAAGLSSNPAWSLDRPRGRALKPKLCDPAVAGDRAAAMDRVRAEVTAALAREPGVRLASAEVVLSESHRTFLTSTGLDEAASATFVILEMVLVAGEGDGEVESHVLREERFLDVVAPAVLVARHAEQARQKLGAAPTRGGRQDVVFTDGAVVSLFEWFRRRVSGFGLYSKLSSTKVGDEVVPGARGDRLTLAYDPCLRGGTSSSSFDFYGTRLRPLTFVRDGVVLALPCDKRHADYLGLPVTGVGTNLVVAPGRTAYDALVRDGALVVHEVSVFEPHAASGSFSAEIRLGTQGGRAVRGGSVSGRVLDAFRDVRLSRDLVQLGAYRGPRALRLAGLTVGGA